MRNNFASMFLGTNQLDITTVRGNLHMTSLVLSDIREVSSRADGCGVVPCFYLNHASCHDTTYAILEPCFVGLLDLQRFKAKPPLWSGPILSSEAVLVLSKGYFAQRLKVWPTNTVRKVKGLWCTVS